MISSKLGRGVALGVFLMMFVILVLGNNLQQAFADSSGSIRQRVENSKTAMYVSKVEINENSGQKQIEVTVLFKNKDFKPQLFNIFYMKLKDTDGREYDPEIFGSESLDAAVPTRDTARAVLLFQIPAATSPKSFTYSELLEFALTVDLTKEKSPADSEPKSDWRLSSNKGFSAKDSSMELTINDETRTSYGVVLDITIKNLGRDSIPYNPLYAYVKDNDGIMYSYDIFDDDDTPLSYGDLAPNDIVRGNLAFKLQEPSSAVMFIWSGNFGFDSFFNTGTLIQLQSQSFTLKANKADVNLEIQSNSKISNVRVEDEKKQLSFTAEGENGVIVIPIGKVLKGEFLVMINGVNYEDFEVNGEDSDLQTIQINYPAEKADVTIVGTEVVPEFPLLLLGTSAAAMTGITVILGTSRLMRR